MRSIIIKFSFLVLVLSCLSCKKNQASYDIGSADVWKNNNFWDCQIQGSPLVADNKESYKLIFHNFDSQSDNQKGKIHISQIPFEKGKMNPQSYDRNDFTTIDLTKLYILYTSEDGQDSTPLGYWVLIPNREENHFEITFLSDNHRKVDGHFDLAFTAESDHVKQITGEPDTLFFVGTFEAKLPR